MARLPSKLLHVLVAAVVILCMATSSCKAQDAVQIVARAALCFDNHTVINRCLQQMGISTNATTAPGGSGFFDKLPTSPNAGAVLCGTPCFGHMMLMTNCVDGILSNFQGYSSGLMQGVRAIFQMSCGGAGSGGDAEGDGPPAHGAPKGGTSAASDKVARNVNGGAASASAAVPAANGAAAGGLGHVGNLVWVGIIILVAAQYGAI